MVKQTQTIHRPLALKGLSCVEGSELGVEGRFPHDASQKKFICCFYYPEDLKHVITRVIVSANISLSMTSYKIIS